MIGSPAPRTSLIRLAIPAALIFACAVVLGWNAGDTIVPMAAAPAPIRWSLPQPKADDAARDMAALTTAKPWHRDFPGLRPAAPTPGQAAAADWRLAGIVDRDEERYALVLSGAGAAAKIAYLQVGDTLPDGSVIVALTRDSAAAEGGKPPAHGHRIYRLFGEKR